MIETEVKQEETAGHLLDGELRCCVKVCFHADMCFPLPLQPEMVKNLLLSMRALSKKTCLLAVLKPFLTNQGFSSEKFAWKFNTV